MTSNSLEALTNVHNLMLGNSPLLSAWTSGYKVNDILAMFSVLFMATIQMNHCWRSDGISLLVQNDTTPHIFYWLVIYYRCHALPRDSSRAFEFI